MKGQVRHIAIVVGLLVMSWPSFCQENQCCVDFSLLKKDTLLTQSSISVIEVPPGKQARITFESITPVIYDTAFAKTGAWTYAKNTADPFLNNTVYFSNQVGATLIYNVYGRSFEVITSLDKHHGQVGISLNNGPEVLVNLYSGTRVNEKVVYSSPMPFGTNSIKIRVIGGGYGVIDYIKVKQ